MRKEKIMQPERDALVVLGGALLGLVFPLIPIVIHIIELWVWLQQFLLQSETIPLPM